MIVFPKGSVIKMTTPVVAGQMVVVTNLKSGHDAICRIVKVRPYAQAHSYVEIEFTHRQPGYWGVQFPSDPLVDTAPAAQFAPPVSSPAVSVEVKMDKAHDKASEKKAWEPAAAIPQKSPATPPVRTAPAIPSAPPSPARVSAAPVTAERSKVRPIKPESKFVEIGSQEDVQPAASSTARTADSFTRSERPIHVASPSASVSLAQARANEGATAGTGSLAAAEETGGLVSGIAEIPEATNDTSFGTFAADSILEERDAAQEASAYRDILSHSHPPKQTLNWLPVSLGVGALLVTVIGGAFLFHLGPFARAESEPTVAPTTALASRTSVPPEVTPSAVASVATKPPVAVKAPVPVQPVESEPAKPAQAATPDRVASAPASSKSAAKVPDMFGALNAHPTLQKGSHSAAVDTTPALDAASASVDNSALQEIAAPSGLGPVLPSSGVSQPSRTGGQLKPPRLISSVLPTYPTVAKQAGVEGDVVVDASIDSAGNVATAKVVSGPIMLRQAALDALRQWKYEPTMLNGQPVPVEITITIRFHR